MLSIEGALRHCEFDVEPGTDHLRDPAGRRLGRSGHLAPDHRARRTRDLEDARVRESTRSCAPRYRAAWACWGIRSTPIQGLDQRGNTVRVVPDRSGRRRAAGPLLARRPGHRRLRLGPASRRCRTSRTTSSSTRSCSCGGGSCPGPVARASSAAATAPRRPSSRTRPSGSTGSRSRPRSRCRARVCSAATPPRPTATSGSPARRRRATRPDRADARDRRGDRAGRA